MAGNDVFARFQARMAKKNGSRYTQHEHPIFCQNIPQVPQEQQQQQQPPQQQLHEQQPQQPTSQERQVNQIIVQSNTHGEGSHQTAIAVVPGSHPSIFDASFKDIPSQVALMQQFDALAYRGSVEVEELKKRTLDDLISDGILNCLREASRWRHIQTTIQREREELKKVKRYLAEDHAKLVDARFDLVLLQGDMKEAEAKLADEKKSHQEDLGKLQALEKQCKYLEDIYKDATAVADYRGKQLVRCNRETDALAERLKEAERALEKERSEFGEKLAKAVEQREAEMDNDMSHIARESFENAVDQLKVLNPNLNVSGISPNLCVVDGKICERMADGEVVPVNPNAVVANGTVDADAEATVANGSS